jgi:hypothetical protein
MVQFDGRRRLARLSKGEEMTDEQLAYRFDLYGALWAFCARWHSGQFSRGYRILSRLAIANYSPGIGLQAGRFESEAQRDIYRHLVRHYRNSV